VREVKTD